VSNCEPYGPYVQDPPAQKLFLAEAATGMRTERAFDGGHNGQFPHWVDRDGPRSCR